MIETNSFYLENDRFDAIGATGIESSTVKA